MTPTEFTHLEEEALLTTRPTEPFGFVALSSGRTHILRPEEGGESGTGSAEVSGVIFTNRTDMPSLEALLSENQVAYAVLERPVPIAVQPGAGDARPSTGRPSAARIVVGAGIGIATSAVGWTLFADAVAETSIRANPYTALVVALSGLIILASVLIGLSQPPRNQR
jgi:hypothetical protein